MPTVNANGIDINYEVLGDDRPGTPLVMTHGFASNFSFWLPDLVPLAEKRRLIVYDVRGHGKTSVPESIDAYSMATFAADLAGLMKAIGIEKAHMVGVSMGGMIAAQFAVDYPEMCESVALIDTTCGNGFDTGPGGDWERSLVTGLSTLSHMASTYGLRETLIKEWEYRKANDPHIDVSPYTLDEDFNRIEEMTLPGYLGAAHAIATRPDLTPRITSITAPTLVMVGEWDDFRPCAERDHKLIPGSRLVVREECAHGTRWHVETFRSELESFLEDAESAQPVAAERSV
jgi:pimeloyl-ACP methyl ester carboxylesterase